MLNEKYTSGVLISLGWINVKMFLLDMHTIQKQVLRQEGEHLPLQRSRYYLCPL